MSDSNKPEKDLVSTDLQMDTINRRNQIVLNFMSQSVVDITENFKAESEEDNRRRKEARKIIKDIANDFSELTQKIQRDNEKGLSVKNSIRAFKDSHGGKEKLKMAGSVVDAIAHKLPIVRNIVRYVEKQAAPEDQLSNALESQYEKVKIMHNALHQVLFGDKNSLTETKNILKASAKKYTSQMIALQKEKEQVQSELEGLLTSEYTLRSQLLEGKDVESPEDLDLSSLTSEELSIYEEFQGISDQVFEHKLRQGEIDQRAKIIGRYVQDKRLELKTVLVYHQKGQAHYEKLTQFIEGAGDSTSIVARAAELEQILISTADDANNLSDNYNAAILKLSEHAVKLSEHGKDLIPDYLSDLSTTKKANDNLYIAVKKTIESNPIAAARHFSQIADSFSSDGSSLEQLTDKYSEQDKK